MHYGALTAYMDVAQMTLWAFWLFFFGLILYLRREDRREGYPLEADTTGKIEKTGWLWIPPAKTFELYHGGQSKAPDFKRDTRALKGKRTKPWSGSPYVPTGPNPMLDCIGPSSYAEREDKPELDLHAAPKIQPMRNDKTFTMESSSPDPRGMPVVGRDGKQAGTISDLWVDRPEIMVRYFEVQLAGAAAPAGDGQAAGGAKRILLPVNFAHVSKARGRVEVSAITGDQFKQVPVTKKPDQVTKLEEERICAYYGSGPFYAQS